MEGGAGPGGAEPGRGAVPQLDGRGRPERRRRRTVSDRPTPGARVPDRADSADPLVQVRPGPLARELKLPWALLLCLPTRRPHLSPLRIRLWLSPSSLCRSCFPRSLFSLTLFGSPISCSTPGAPSPLTVTRLCLPSPASWPQSRLWSPVEPSGFHQGPVKAWRSQTLASLPAAFPSSHLHQEMRKLRQRHHRLKVTDGLRLGRPHLNLTPEFPG